MTVWKATAEAGEDRGDAKSGGENVKEAAYESADGGLEAFATAASEAAGQDVEDAWAGSYSKKERGREEDEKTVRVKHQGIVGIRE